MVSLTVYSLGIVSHRYLDSDCIISNFLYSWLFIGPSEHHHTTQTSKLKKKNGASTILNRPQIFENSKGKATLLKGGGHAKKGGNCISVCAPIGFKLFDIGRGIMANELGITANDHWHPL